MYSILSIGRASMFVMPCSSYFSKKKNLIKKKKVILLKRKVNLRWEKQVYIPSYYIFKFQVVLTNCCNGPIIWVKHMGPFLQK